MALLPGHHPYNGYNINAQSVNMDSTPSLTHSAMSTGTDVMDIESRPLEDHQALIQAYGRDLQNDQLRRQYQQQQRQQRIAEQQYQLLQQQQFQQQQQQLLQQQHLHDQYHAQEQPQEQPQEQQKSFLQFQYPRQQQYPPYTMRSEKQQQGQHYYYQQQYQNQQQNLQQNQQQNQHQQFSGAECSVDAELPSLSFSSDESTASSNFQSGSPSQSPLSSRRSLQAPNLGVGIGIGAPAGYRAAGGVFFDADPDHEYFLTSVLNMITSTTPASGSPSSLAHFDYQAEFTQRQRIAKGGNGEVRRAFWPSRQCFVILKSLIEAKHKASKLASLFDKEASILSSHSSIIHDREQNEVQVMNLCGNHDNIVQFYGVAARSDQEHVERFMVMQYYEHGDLVKLMEKPRYSPDAPTLVDRLFLAYDIALGLDHLFQCGFHHGDLHPKNILIDDRQSSLTFQGQRGRYQARLTDFGLRRIRDNKNNVSSQQFGGVWQFMAPERMCKNRPRYNVVCDIFALGVIYWFIMAGRYPFKDPSTYTPGAREDRIEGTPDWYYEAYTRAWSEDPNERQQDLEEIIQVFRQRMSIPTSSPSLSTSSGGSLTSHQQRRPDSGSMYTPHATPSYGYYGTALSPGTPMEGNHLGHGYPSGSGSSYRGGSSIPCPTLVAPSPNQGGPSATHLPLPKQSNVAASTSSTTRSSNPNHPRNKKVSVPNGMPRRFGH
ncbi:hypothetical protein BG011_005654 [Mortierella polycephala]|uniref:Protein kinase domain-containing protein n=1 Tax=Mortierella polycephala TaxID=41804 RepID=A0A9P6U0Z9_9FUNG|nr:hypothetical protein BG011_005654 [Mortierella polycephala]